MKKSFQLIVLASLLLLAACQPATNQKGQTVSKKESTEKSAVSQSKKNKPTYNGSYYSIEGKYGPVIVVNKTYPLDAAYAPGEDPTAQAAFLELVADMRAEGFPVSDQYSGFRSYDTQVNLYNNYVSRDGQEAADRYSARPGYSEHQTGLAYDLLDTSGNLLTEPSAVTWLMKNASKYGFIVRYIEGKEEVTGYMAESWHVRYIGKEAQDIADSGLTLEEYFNIEGGSYKE